MLLSDIDIERRIESGDIGIDPPGVMQPASVDLHLDFSAGIKCQDGLDYQPSISDSTLALPPGALILARTRQHITLPGDIAGVVDGRSSWARAGLVVHLTAGFIDPGFRGYIVLEMINCSNGYLSISSDQAICQILFQQLSSPTSRPYGSSSLGSHYQDQVDVKESKYSTKQMKHLYY